MLLTEPEAPYSKLMEEGREVNKNSKIKREKCFDN
jgi:hypothetical protein